MSTITEKAKYGLDWMQHGYLVFQLLSSAAVGKGAKAILLTWAHVPPIWISPIELGASAATFALLVYLGNRIKRTPVQEKGSQSLIPTPIVNPATTIDMYYHRINPEYRGEVETALRTTANKVPSAERETYLFRALTVAYISSQLETVWHSIYASQIKALQRLNNVQLKREEIFPFYTEAAATSPRTYADYSFDKWLGYMRSQTVIREDGDLVSITIKGRDFLKYLIDEAKPVASKTL